MRRFFERLWRDETGQDLVEYGLLLALAGLAAIGAMKSLSDSISNMFSTIGSDLGSASS